MCSVVNRRTHDFDIYIGRGSFWGNEFSHKKGTQAKYLVATREEAVECYRQQLWQKIKDGVVTIEMLLELDGNLLGCYCSPLPCHGDVLVKAVKWAKQQRR
ncbi:hypothetical protein KoPa4_00035 [Pseudomonas phage vB_PpuM-KoPa-4]|uniref:DUF4326 domain-containing protein n=1 Tax=Pseudomonas phage vB_PpuM-KoPa-4 TaxID=3132618 RepID=A0AAX4MYQ3_9CAUD